VPHPSLSSLGRRTCILLAAGSILIGFVLPWRLPALNSLQQAMSILRGLALLQQGSKSSRPEQEWHESIDQAPTVMLNCITRFRVLVSDELAEAAIRVRQHNDKDLETIDSGDSAMFLQERKRHLVFDADRDKFIKLVQEVLGVK
jgi:hypothetical protein